MKTVWEVYLESLEDKHIGLSVLINYLVRVEKTITFKDDISAVYDYLILEGEEREAFNKKLADYQKEVGMI